ncbi:E3 SUMO-protein ligase ZBED1-like [Carassius gibelio]|uniref:E3 SUMO-protein ligase ZBED1-like n=2 Tax=Carassius gibelio TaxID=101364 RepID=UPI002279C502|nr:E3 SUMO-protein ligase ZBED1-like [Carassius gibelio]
MSQPETSAAAADDLVPKRRSTSKIWQFFGFKRDDHMQTEVICKTCKSRVATKTGNTSNLFSHLKAKHNDLYQLCSAEKSSSSGESTLVHQPKQQSISSSFESITPYPVSSRRHREITEAITRYLAKDMVPIATVGKPGFLHLMNTIDKRYNIPSRTYFSRIAIPQMYEHTRDRVMLELRDVEHFACTTDLWSSRTTEPYISLTVHFIDKAFKMRSLCLQTAYFPSEHSGENIALGLREALSGWNLNEARLVCFTTDNATNMIKAAEINGWPRLQCFGHRLHLAIENAVKCDTRISRALGVCKKQVGHFSHSWKKKEALKKAQRELNLPEHGLITECPTRWGTKQQMMERILEQQRALSQVLSENRSTRHLVPSWQDIEVLESVNKALKPLQDFTDALSGEEYVSISYLLPVLRLLNTQTLAADEEDTELTCSIKTKVLGYMEAKYEDPATQTLLNIATFLDPRFKKDYIPKEQREEISLRIKSEMKEAQPAVAISSSSVGAAVSGAEAEPCQSATATSTKRMKKSLGSLLQTSVTSPSESSDHATIEAEFNSYILIPKIHSEQDPLAWWGIHKVNFPHLSKLAEKYLCVPATSTPSERLFSTPGNVVTCQRASLKPNKVDMLVFLSKNF